MQEPATSPPRLMHLERSTRVCFALSFAVALALSTLRIRNWDTQLICSGNHQSVDDCQDAVLRERARVRLLVERALGVDSASRVDDVVTVGPPGSVGIVVLARRDELALAAVSVEALRKLGSTLPVIVVTESHELSVTAIECAVLSASSSNATCAAAPTQVAGQPVTGYALKPIVIAGAPFETVIFLDADAHFLADPDHLLRWQAFADTGMLLWPDRVGDAKGQGWGKAARSHHAIWEVIGRTYDPANYLMNMEAEASLIVIDKRRHWRALLLTVWMNLSADMYKLVHGDKDTFRLAWLALGAPMHFVRIPMSMGVNLAEPTGTGLLRTVCPVGVLIHNGPDGCPIVLHRYKARLFVDALSKSGAGFFTHTLSCGDWEISYCARKYPNGCQVVSLPWWSWESRLSPISQQGTGSDKCPRKGLTASNVQLLHKAAQRVHSLLSPTE